jgi:hypothetical protein
MHGQEKAYLVVALLACVQAAGLALAKDAPNSLDKRYPRLFGAKAKATIVSFTARW